MKSRLRFIAISASLILFLTGTSQTLSVDNLVYTAHSDYATVKGEANEDCSNLQSEVVIDDVAYRVTEVEAGSTGKPSMTTSGDHLILPSSIVKIGDYAFSGANFEVLDIPANVKEIGAGIIQGSSIATLNYNAVDCTSFGSLHRGYSSNLRTVVIGDAVETVPAGFLLFNDELTIPATSSSCKVKSLTVGKSVSKIGTNAFTPAIYLTTLDYRSTYMDPNESRFGINVENLTLAEGITSIPNYFLDYRTSPTKNDLRYLDFSPAGVLTSLNLPKSVKSIGKYAFVGQKNLAIVECEGSVGESAFEQNRSLKAVVVKGTIAKNAFRVCTNLLYVISGSLSPSAFIKHTFGSATGFHEFPYIELTENCRSIGSNALNDNSKLRIVKAPAVPPTLTSTSFNDDTYTKGVLIVPVGSKTEYQKYTSWSKFATIVECDYFPTSEVIEKVKLSTKISDQVAVSHSSHNLGDEAKVEVNPMEGWEIAAAKFNGADVISDFKDNAYITPPLEKDSELVVDLAYSHPYEVLDVTSSLVTLPDSNLTVRATSEFLEINGLHENANISLFTFAGLRLFNVTSFGPMIRLSLKDHVNGVYILTIDSKGYKLIF